MYQPSFQNQYKPQFNAQRPQQPLFPAHFARLQVVCANHPRPVPMEFIGYSWSDKLPRSTGSVQRVALYRCQVDGTVEAYAQHSHTGEPFLLRTVPAALMNMNEQPAPQANHRAHTPLHAAAHQRPQRHSFY